MFNLIQKIFEKEFEFDSHDAARSFFLDLHNDLKNLNYLVYNCSEYKQLFERIKQKLNI